MNICVIGAGISGVSLAFWLNKLKKDSGLDLNIKVLERRGQPGGCIDTGEAGGFKIEGGPNGFLDSKPKTLELFAEAGLSDNLLRSNDLARKRYIMRNKKLVMLPSKPPQFFTSKILSFTGKMRVMMEILVSAKRDGKDETVADFCRRRLGAEALEYMIGPMVSGVFAGDSEKLSLESAFPVIHNLETEYGGLFKGLIKKKNKKGGADGPAGVLTSYKGGFINAVKDLAEKCGDTEFIFGCAVESIKKDGTKLIVKSNIDECSYDYVFSCAPAYESANFLKPLHEGLSEVMGSIPYAPAFVTGLGFESTDIEDDLDGFGYLIPFSEKRNILGALFTSSIFPERSPEGKKLVRVIMGGDRNSHIMKNSDEKLVQMALEDIGETLGVKQKPVAVKHFRWEKAIPQYHVGHREKVALAEKYSSEIGNFFIGGNVLTGIALNDCVLRSWNIFERFKTAVETMNQG